MDHSLLNTFLPARLYNCCSFVSRSHLFIKLLRRPLNHGRYFFGMRFIDGVARALHHYPLAVGAVVVPFLEIGIDDLV